MDDREPYEAPAVQEQSVEEMLTEAQSAVDKVMERFRKVEASLEDLEAVASTMGEEARDLAEELTRAEGLVQKVAYVAKVRGEHADSGGS